MKVLGFAKVPEMLEKGVCVTIGTDGAPANNRMTLVDEMWLTSLIHKGRTLDPTVVPAEAVLKMVTKNASKALLVEQEIGSLQAGKKADLIVVNPNSAAMLPMHDPAANMVSAMRSENIESVMVNGRWIMKDKIIRSVNEQEIIHEARLRAAALAKRAGIKLPDRFNLVD
jgi:5-methylthioadenosine/S-adenosylhomocysteine deaminase